MFWLLLLLVFVIILLFFRIYVAFSVTYNKEKKFIDVSFQFLGIRFLHKKIVLDNINATAEWEHLLRGKDVKQRLENLWNAIKKSLYSMSDAIVILHILLTYLSFHKLYWYTGFGTGDAGSTGVAAGSVWSAKGLIIGLLENTSTLDCIPDIQVSPHFQMKYLDLKMDCIVSLRLGQAIHALIKVIRKSSFQKSEALI